jgi:hypothetical protein
MKRLNESKRYAASAVPTLLCTEHLRGSIKRILIAAGLVLAMASMPHMLRAQTAVPVVPTTFKVLDDFAIGTGAVDTTSGGTVYYTEPSKGEHIIGGTRAFQIALTFLNSGLPANNPYTQPNVAQVVPNPGNGRPPAFIGWFGYGASGRIYLWYGSGTSLLNANLTGYDRLRVVFASLTTALNFNIEAWQGSNNEAGNIGINLAPSPGPFTVDFPLSAFKVGTTALDWSDIEILEMIFQDNPNLAITGFYAIPKGVITDGPAGTVSGPATYTAGPS